MGCFLHVLLSPPVFLEFLLCGWGSSPLLPLHVCLRDVLQLPSLLGLLLDHVPPQPNYSAASFFCHQCPQSFTPALSSPLFLPSIQYCNGSCPALVLMLLPGACSRGRLCFAICRCCCNILQNGTAQQCLHTTADIKFCLFSVTVQITIAKTDCVELQGE